MQYTLDSFTEWSTSSNGASEETLERQLEMFVEVLQAQAGGPLGYRLRRIILTNFWLYGLQEFEIPHGRLFLLVPAQQLVGEFLATFKAFPPRQKAASFSIDQMLDKYTSQLAA